MKKTNKTLAVVLATAMFATLGCGYDNSFIVKADTQVEQITQTANDKNSEKGILDGFKTIKTFNFNDKYAYIALKNDKYTVQRRKTKDVNGNEKQALFRIDGKKILDYTRPNKELLSNGCVLSKNYLYSKSMKIVNKKVTEFFDIDNNYILVKLKKKYDYRIFDSKGKVVKKIKNKSDLLSAIKEYNLFEDFFTYSLDREDFKKESEKYYLEKFKSNLEKYNLVQNAENGTISNKDGKEIAISKDNIYFKNNCYYVENTSNDLYELYNAEGKIVKKFNYELGTVISDLDRKHVLIRKDYLDDLGKNIIYIVDLESGETKKAEFKCDNDRNLQYSYNYSAITYYEELNAFKVYCDYIDSGVIDYESFYFDLDGNEMFKNSDGIEVRDYLGNGYFTFSKNNKLRIGLLKSFPEVKASKIVKKIRFWKDYPRRTKIKKIKRSGNTLKISLKKVKEADGYFVDVYTSERNAFYYIKPVVFKSKKPLVKVNLKKFKNKKKIYIKVYTYVKDIDGHLLINKKEYFHKDGTITDYKKYKLNKK